MLVALTAGLAFWIVAWGLGVKSFDAFMVVIALVVTAFTVRLLTPFVKEQLGR